MGLEGRLVAKYAGSSKLPKRISLIISGMNFCDMLDIAKWLRMRRKYPGRDLLLATVCRTGTESRETLPLWWWPDGESATERHATRDGGSGFRRGFLLPRGIFDLHYMHIPTENRLKLSNE